MGRKKGVLGTIWGHFSKYKNTQPAQNPPPPAATTADSAVMRGVGVPQNQMLPSHITTQRSPVCLQPHLPPPVSVTLYLPPHPPTSIKPRQNHHIKKPGLASVPFLF